ncbi:DUF2961 domain-containing protein [Prolixibacteraceae bacterium JC049]|nr:DUF2961 domain-containing protein [Prolixibacteraceae bacterium JC049]
MTKFLVPMAIAVLLLLSSNLKAQTITMATLLKEMTNKNQLASFPSPSYLCKQTSSYSRASVTPNAEDGKYIEKNGRDWGKGWFENHDFGNFIRTETNQGRKEDVMLDVKGPGAIVRWWHTLGGRANMGGIYRIYIDGNPQPALEMYIKNLVGGNGLVKFPFSYNAPAKTENDNWRGQNFMLPIPFQKGCKITFDGFQKYKEGWPGFYYQINYREYIKGTQVESFTAQSVEKYKQQIQQAGKELTAALPKTASTAPATTIASGKSFKHKIKGSKVINQLSFKLKANNLPQALRSTVLKIEFDNQETVWCPVGQFFGMGYQFFPHKTFYIEVDKDGLMTATWPMPFENKAQITLHNYGKQSVEIEQFHVVSDNWQWTDNSMHFYATWKERRNIDTTFRVDEDYVKVKGKGVYVGDNLTIFNTHPDWWGEGDEKIFVDGEKFPSHIGTGTEDYYCYAWCRPQFFSYPFISQPTGGGNKTVGMSSNNRYRSLDAIPFNQSLDFYMEIWHPFRAKMNYSPATFFYAVPNTNHNIQPDVNGVQLKVALKKEDVK